MRDGNRIERVGEGAVGGGHHDDEDSRARREEENQHCNQRSAEGGTRQHEAAVSRIGKSPRGELHGRAGDDHQAHHQRDPGGGNADAGAIDGAERAPGAIGDADQKAGHRRNRRICVKAFDVELDVLQRLRMRLRRHRGRNERQAEQDAGDHEQRGRLHVAAGDDHLAAHDRGIGDHHIEAEDGAAVLVGGLLVEPAFDDHEGGGHGEAGEGAQQDPEILVDDEAGDHHTISWMLSVIAAEVTDTHLN